MTCRFCNLFHGVGEKAHVVVLEHDRHWLFSCLCDDCIGELEPDQYHNHIVVEVKG